MSEIASSLDAARQRLGQTAPREVRAYLVDEPRRPFFTPRTLAEYLGVSERTARQMIADRRIESVKVEGVRRVMAEDVDAYVARNRVERA